ncbi:hypothetical protein C0036_27765 [Streptomyces sp. DJ]|nr:hypothetical protein C0036_27765 [Streptomyces sp. DJ]
MTDRRRPPALRLRATAASAAAVSLIGGCASLPGAPSTSTEPVVVMTWAPEGTRANNMSGMPAMAQAYSRYVNANGGINGRELKVVTCNEGHNSVKAARCARRAVTEGAVAVVGSYSEHGRSFMPTLEAAGIPYVGGYGIASEEFTSASSYPVNGGTPALLAGNGRQLADSCERVSLVRPDSIAGDPMPDFLSSGLTAGGRGTARDIMVAHDSTDYTSQAHAAIGDDLPSSCVSAVLGERTDTFFDSFRRLKPDNTRIASVLGSIDQSLVDRTGGADGPLEGAWATGWYPPADDPRWDGMRKVVRTHAFGDNRIDISDPGAQTTWIAYTVFTSAARALGDKPVTARTIARELDNGEGIGTGGLTQRLSWRYSDLLAVHDYPRIVNTSVTFQVVRNGRLTAMRDRLVDVRVMLEGADDPA